MTVNKIILGDNGCSWPSARACVTGRRVERSSRSRLPQNRFSERRGCERGSANGDLGERPRRTQGALTSHNRSLMRITHSRRRHTQLLRGWRHRPEWGPTGPAPRSSPNPRRGACSVSREPKPSTVGRPSRERTSSLTCSRNAMAQVSTAYTAAHGRCARNVGKRGPAEASIVERRNVGLWPTLDEAATQCEIPRKERCY